MGNIESNHLLQFVLIVGFAASVISNVVTIFLATGNRRQRREVSFTADYATRSELEEVKHDVEALARESREENAAIRAKMEADKLTIIGAGEDRAGKIYTRIEQVRESIIAEMHKAMELTQQQVARLDAKLDRIMERKQ